MSLINRYVPLQQTLKTQKQKWLQALMRNVFIKIVSMEVVYIWNQIFISRMLDSGRSINRSMERKS